MEDRSENFHIVFLLRMSRMLGFGAHHVNEVLGARVTSLENEAALDRLIKSDYLDYVPIQNHQRREILDLVLKFYADHMDNLGEMKSIQVLREIL